MCCWFIFFAENNGCHAHVLTWYTYKGARRILQDGTQHCSRIHAMLVQVHMCFEHEYLRKPTHEDIVTQMIVNQDRGWPGMFGSIDCMHQKWKLWHVALQWFYQDKNKNKSNILEVLCDYELWIWHAFFDILGGDNEMNVFDRSLLVQNLLFDHANGVGF